jgi:hypothetical protein
MTRSPLARILTVLSVAAVLVVGAACGDQTDRPALSGDVVTTTPPSTTTTTASP